jgi:acyl dehydratase
MSLATSYAKAAAGALPLPLLTSRSGELPDRVVERTAQPSVDHVSRYAHVCGFRLRDELPATYPHMLAFGLAMELMTDRSFPFPLLGLVHVENRIEQRRPLRISDSLELRVHAEGLRPHAKGRQFDVVEVASVDGEDAWVCRSTYLRRGKGGDEDAAERRDPVIPEHVSATIKVPGDIGRRYAAVSGDRNPIHLHPLSARLFGFPKAIAHGMWTKARCLAAYEGRLPDTFAVDVAFKAPLLIPSTVKLKADERHFALAPAKGDESRIHLAGTIEPL